MNAGGFHPTALLSRRVVRSMIDDWYLWALAAGAVVVAVLAWRVPRAPMWVGLGALSFLTSGWWHDAGLPYGAAYGAFTNFVIIAALYAYAITLYELTFMGCFIVMVAIDFLNLTNTFNSHHDFAVALELANWLALLSVGAAGMADRAGIGLAWVAVFRTRPRWIGAVHLRVHSAAAHLAGKPPA